MKSISITLVSLLSASVFIALPALADSAPAATPHLTQAITTSGASLAAGKRVPTETFSQEDYVVQMVDFDWDNVGQGGGLHQVEWRWYHDDQLVSKTSKRLDFNSTPYTLWTKRAAATLGIGHFKVEAVIDGAVATISEFDITS